MPLVSDWGTESVEKTSSLTRVRWLERIMHIHSSALSIISCPLRQVMARIYVRLGRSKDAKTLALHWLKEAESVYSIGATSYSNAMAEDLEIFGISPCVWVF